MTEKKAAPTNGNRKARLAKAQPRAKSEVGSSGARRSAIRLYEYQKRWLLDDARFKLAVKATQIGYSFAAALEAVLDCLQQRTLWIVLSRGERQSLEFMQKVREHARALRAAGGKLETTFFEHADILQHEVRFPNGSRVIGLPANADTARGYTGNMILDEFAFHRQDRDIWAAAFGRVSRGGLKLRVISTPNGQRGKFYELAKEAGLAGGSGGATPGSDFAGSARGIFSGHWCDVHTAVAQGCPIDVAALRKAIGDEETFQQEYECVFHSGTDRYIPLELIAQCEHPEATVEPAWEGNGREFYFGYDVARVRDLAVLAVVERVGDVLWTRGLIELPQATFSLQEKTLCDVIPRCVRGAIDATGMGMEMAERLAARFPGRVEPVVFNAARKQELAVRVKRCFEERAIRVPDHRELRRDLAAVKRQYTVAGNIRFDAERTEQGHADRFWAMALALHAAGSGKGGAASVGIESDAGTYASAGTGFREGRERGADASERGDAWL